MPHQFFQKQSVILVYVCLKLIKKLTESQPFYFKLFIAVDQKGK